MLKKLLTPSRGSVVSFIVVFVFLYIGSRLQKCVSCIETVDSWKCGCNPLLGFVPSSVYVVLSVVLLVLTYTLPNYLRKK